MKTLIEKLKNWANSQSPKRVWGFGITMSVVLVFLTILAFQPLQYLISAMLLLGAVGFCISLFNLFFKH